MVLVVQVSPCTHIVYACSGWSSLLVAKRAINKIKNYWILNYLFKLLSKPFDFIFELCNGGGYVWIDNEQRLRNLQYNKKCISKNKNDAHCAKHLEFTEWCLEYMMRFHNDML